MIGPDQESVRQRAVTGDLFADPLTDSPQADSACLHLSRALGMNLLASNAADARIRKGQ